MVKACGNPLPIRPAMKITLTGSSGLMLLMLLILLILLILLMLDMVGARIYSVGSALMVLSFFSSIFLESERCEMTINRFE